MKKFNLLALAGLLIMISCKDNSEEVTPGDQDQVNKDPSATISIESAAETLWNTVVVTVDAVDTDGEIEKVELYANDKIIGAASEAPFEFSWNTKDIEDGEVELKAVVVDDKNAVKEEVKNVNVLNTLIDFDLFDGYMNMSPSYKYFAFISSNSKEVLFFDQIEVTPYQNKINRPEDFDDEVFDVHFVMANGTYAKITTYNDFNPGVFAPIKDDQKGEGMGEASMKFTNIPTHDYFTLGGYGGNPLKENNPYNVGIFENLDLGYLYLRNEGAGFYKMMKNLSPGDDEVSLAAMGYQMDLHTINIDEKLSGFNINVYGHTEPGVNSPSLRVFGHFKFGDMENYEVTFHTPSQEASFDHFSSFLAVSQEGKSYVAESYFDVLTAPVKLNAEFQVSGFKLENPDFSATSDPRDVLVTNFSFVKDGLSFNWESHSNDEEIEFPFIPTELTQAFPKISNTNLVFEEGSVYLKIQDFDHLQGYDSYLSALSGRTGKSLKEGGTFNVSLGQSFNP